ncbi:pyridoxamine 5'-phosphate oxidase family protein [Rothia halotolerans]|uniref:pyridoxamine 5'-phosphate oxidase family protein n=1 Tax=Rothia halotolerans TaxID=405770 RepID=UPI00101D8DF4|nr:pyridoxamine 5'-phosphate oxidase family protein [Rothia halotolerans]
MTSPNPHDLPRIDEQRCWDLLRSHAYGRLAVAAAGVIDIYPVNHGVLEGSLCFRTAEGTKLASVVVGRDVAFEIDEVADGVARSVVVHGRAEVVEDAELLGRLDGAGVESYAPTVKTVWVRVTPERIDGREFEVGPEPPRE